MEKPLQVLVIDDSALMRSLITKMLQQDHEVEVAAIAMNGEFALKKIIKYDIDVITLDLEMPVMNGLDFLKERQKLGITIPVIVFSSIAHRGAKITMEALAAGASDFILKPTGTGSDVEKMKQRLVTLVKVFGEKYRTQKKQQRSLETQKIPETDKLPVRDRQSDEPFILKDQILGPKRGTQFESIDIIAIGISTGGPNALRKILPDLHKDLPVPVIIVQHMPPGFTEELSKSLNKISNLEVKEAHDGDLIKKGRILIAPGGYHLTIEKKPLCNIIKLNHNEAVNGHRPSVDVLFSAVADLYHNNCMALIMTGMGKDGVNGTGKIYNNGGLTIAQEESSCIVPGMPGAAIKAGYIDHIIPLDQLAASLNELVFKYHKGAN